MHHISPSCGCKQCMLRCPAACAPPCRDRVCVVVHRAVDARLRWACEDMFGGGQVFPLMIAQLVSGAAPQLLAAAQPDDRRAFAEVGARVLQHAAKAQRNNLAALVADGYSDAALAVAGALQQLQALPAAA